MSLRPVLFLLLFISSFTFAQKPAETFKLKGSVADEITNKPLQGASVQILSRAESKTIAGATCDEKGDFTIEKIAESAVRVKLSMMGYQSMVIDSVNLDQTSRLGLIKLKQAAIVMPDIVIKSLKPMIEFHVDKQVVNMDRVPGNSGSVTQALKNTGAVDVDPATNKITVRGQDIKLQMDGHPFEMSGDMLAQMPASMIDQVELILSPGAKESAEGGTYILNLVSKKNTLDNYNGSISLSSSTNQRNYGGLNLNYKVNKINIFGSLFGGLGEYHQAQENEKLNYYSKSLHNEISSGENNFNGYGAYAKLGFDYNYDDINSFTFYGTLSKNKFNSENINASRVNNDLGLQQYTYRNINKSDFISDNYSFYGFYKRKFDAKGHEITFDAMYTGINSPSTSDMNIGYSYKQAFPYLQKSETGTDAKTLIFKTDYTLPLTDSKLEAGYNFTYRYRENDYNVLNFSYSQNNWLDSLSLTNLFRYKEAIHALYATYSRKFGRFEAKAGLRGEDLITNGEQITSKEDFSETFLNLFPTLNLSYKFNDLLQLGFSAFRRVRYPMMYYVNPFRQYSGPNSYFAGNPKVKPFFVNSYALNLSQYINVYYVYSTGMFTYASAIVQDSVTSSSYINLSENKTYGMELTLPYYNSPMMPFHLPDFITMINLRFTYLYREQTGGYINESLSYIERNPSLNANLGLKLWYGVDANISFYYRPRIENTFRIMSEQKDLSVYLTKGFLENKLKLSVYVMDLLNSQKYENQTFSNSYYSHDISTVKRSQGIMLSISYMFNDYKERRERNVDDGRDASDKKAF